MRLQQQAACCLPVSCHFPARKYRSAPACCLPGWTGAAQPCGALYDYQGRKRFPSHCCLQCCERLGAHRYHLSQHLILHFHDHLVSSAKHTSPPACTALDACCHTAASAAQQDNARLGLRALLRLAAGALLTLLCDSGGLFCSDIDSNVLVGSLPASLSSSTQITSL